MTTSAPPRDSRARLRSAGLRITEQRVTVLDALAEFPHATAERIAGYTRTRLGSVSTQAVYDVLNALVSGGLARRIEPAGSPAVFERRTGDNHHHLVCRTCRVIVDVDCAAGAAPCLNPSDPAGFVVDEAEVIYWGQCAQCRPGHEPSTPTATRPTALEATR
ncbi:MAG: transcriptional repressor [Actinomycetota bacterium]|nr:transcriptional repressor [Actinomycetota bacterium]